MSELLLDLGIELSDEVVSDDSIPAVEDFSVWVQQALEVANYQPVADAPVQISIRIIAEAEMAELNGHYRGKPQPTNVLSFPAELPEGVPLNVLGDMVACAPVIAREALEQSKPSSAHWAHMTLHSILHLLGYDHMRDDEAEAMESLEIAAMTMLGFANPYQISAN